MTLPIKQAMSIISPEDFDAGRIADLLERCGERIGGGEPNTFTDEIYDAIDRLRASPRNTQQSVGMVEQVARALFFLAAPNGDPDELLFHPHADLQKPKWKLYERQASAALEACHHAALVGAARSAKRLIENINEFGNVTDIEFVDEASSLIGSALVLIGGDV